LLTPLSANLNLLGEISSFTSFGESGQGEETLYFFGVAPGSEVRSTKMKAFGSPSSPPAEREMPTRGPINSAFSVETRDLKAEGIAVVEVEGPKPPPEPSRQVVTAPEKLQHGLRGLPAKELVAVAARIRRAGIHPEYVQAATRFALQSVARHQALSEKIAECDTMHPRRTLGVPVPGPRVSGATACRLSRPSRPGRLSTSHINRHGSGHHELPTVEAIGKVVGAGCGVAATWVIAVVNILSCSQAGRDQARRRVPASVASSAVRLGLLCAAGLLTKQPRVRGGLVRSCLPAQVVHERRHSPRERRLRIPLKPSRFDRGQN
jgi:hypothetical protein